MKKKYLKRIVIFSIGLLYTGDVTWHVIKNTTITEKYRVTDNVLYTTSLKSEAFKTVMPPFLGKSIHGFKEALGFRESNGNYFVVSTYGHLGKYQFGISTLKLIGVNNIKLFLKTPEIQEKAFIAYLERNKWVLRKDIKRFKGNVIDGITITESGILAAAHLGGPRNVKRYLRSRGGRHFKDANGTSIGHYMKKFSGYDLSYIIPDKSAKI